MKSFFVVLLVVVVAKARQVCIPGATFKQSCNTCFCTSDGLSAACTLMGCPTENYSKIHPSAQSTTKQTPKKEAKQVCIPNTAFMQSCNSCFCNSDGTDAFCTLKGCPEDNLWAIDPAIELATEKPSNGAGALNVEKRSKRQTEVRQVCKPDTTWKVDCNSCFCNSDGTVATCTAVVCIPKDFWTNHSATRLVTEKPSNEDEALKFSKRSYSTRQSVYGRQCEPGTAVKHYCNTCMCNKLGRVGRCTRMLCDEEVYNEDGTYRISPNGIFKN